MAKLGKFLSALAPMLPGGGLLMGALSGLGSHILGKKTAQLEKDAAFMSAQSMLDAADMSEFMGIWQKDIADSNAAAQFTYSENLLKTAEVNMQYVSYQVAEKKLQIADSGSKLMSEAALRTLKSGINISGSAIDQLTNIQDQMMDEYSKLNFNKEMTSLSILMQANQEASQAKFHGYNIQMRSEVEQAQANYNIMAQKANALGIIESARLQSKTKSFSQLSKSLSSGISLMGRGINYKQTFNKLGPYK